MENFEVPLQATITNNKKKLNCITGNYEKLRQAVAIQNRNLHQLDCIYKNMDLIINDADGREFLENFAKENTECGKIKSVVDLICFFTEDTCEPKLRETYLAQNATCSEDEDDHRVRFPVVIVKPPEIAEELYKNPNIITLLNDRLFYLAFLMRN